MSNTTMDPFHHPSGSPYTCKWCHYSPAEVIFENAKLCSACHEKALLAVQNPQACDVCSTLFSDEKVVRALFSEDGFSHRNEHGLWAAAESGCGLCRLFLLQDPNPDERAFQLPLTLFAQGDPPEENSKGNIKSFSFSTLEDIYTLRLSVAALDDHARKLTNQDPIPKNLGDKSTTKQVREWLNECMTSHTESLSADNQATMPHFPLPTRVIDVGTGSESVVKLFQPASVMHEKYITLSYCWGRQRFLTTLLKNIQAHFQGLEESTLPQTFIDAFKITRLLGFRYIWIDALCIIQDSLEDKIFEIGAMENIYSNSTLTIAVVNATSVTEGFLETKPRIIIDIPYRSNDGASGVIQVSPTETVDLWEESLYTRAWCLQENLLSRRLLLFTNTEVLWQCQSSPMRRPDTAHVEYIADKPQLGFSPFWRIPASISSTVSSTVPPDSRSGSDTELEQARYTIWRNIVQNYSRRNLTVLSDRLPAIGGVAQRFKDSWGDEYCAGIWKRHFIASLTWRRKSNVQRYWPPLTEYRGPSWSWASIEGPIEFDSRLDQGNMRGLGAKLISVEIVLLRNEIPLGEVKNGHAVFEASLIRARDLPTRGLAGQDAEAFRIGGFLTLDDHLEGYWPGAGNAHVLDDELKENGWAMLLGEGQNGSKKATRTTALILTPYTDNTFQRRGFWENSLRGASKWWVGEGNRKVITVV